MAYGLHKWVGAIENVWEDSRREHNLEVKCRDVRKEIVALEFQMVETSNQNLLQNLAALQDAYQDAVITVQSCKRSTFAAPHIDDFEHLEHQLQVNLGFVEGLERVQTGYLKMRVLFTSARTARHLGGNLKLFKIVDDVWRMVTRAIRTDSQCQRVLADPMVGEGIREAIEAIEGTYAAMVDYICEQREKWPKLFLMTVDDLMIAFATQGMSSQIDVLLYFPVSNCNGTIPDPMQTFKLCNVLLPNVTHLTFDKLDTYNVVGIFGGDENVPLNRPASARASLVDWIRGIDMALSERLASEVKKFMEDPKNFKDDIRSNMHTAGQSRVVYLQLKFWQDICKQITFPTSKRSLKPLQQEILDEISIMYVFAQASTTKYAVRTIRNMILALVELRDLLARIIAEARSDMERILTSFTMEGTKWAIELPPEDNPLIVCHHLFKVP